MKDYTFTNGIDSLSYNAGNYAEALAALVFEIGEEEAAKFLFLGVGI